MLNIPDGLPILSAGAHPSPSMGACFMEFNALLAGLEFNDHPDVVDAELTQALQVCNDAMTDEGRISLVPLLGRALGLVAPGFEVAQPYYAQRVADVADALATHNMATHVLRRTARGIFTRKVVQAWGFMPTFDPDKPLKFRAMEALTEFLRSHEAEDVVCIPRRGCDCPFCVKDVTKRTEAVAQIATWLHEAYEEALAQHGWERQVITEVPVEEILPRITPITYVTTN